MSEQSNDAAQRSAHVTRGPAAQDSASVVREWREDGKLVACAEGVAKLREELEAAKLDRVEQAEVQRLTAERDEARSNFGKALAAGAKAEQERDAAEAEAKAAVVRAREAGHDARLATRRYNRAAGNLTAAFDRIAATEAERDAALARVAELEAGMRFAAGECPPDVTACTRLAFVGMLARRILASTALSASVLEDAIAKETEACAALCSASAQRLRDAGCRMAALSMDSQAAALRARIGKGVA